MPIRAIVGLLLVLLITPTVSAQKNEYYAPQVSSRDVTLIVEEVGLDSFQEEAVRDVYAAYLADVERASQTMREWWEEIGRIAEEEGDWSVYNETGDEQRLYEEHRKNLARNFHDDVRILLSDAQVPAWERVERRLRRQRLLSEGYITASDVDVTELTRELELPEPAFTPIDEVLIRYEIELDQALRARADYLKDAVPTGERAYESGDLETVNELYDEGRGLLLRVRDLHLSYADRIEAMLPEDRREGFRRSFNRRAFPDIFRDSGALRAIATAKQFSDITPSQAERLDVIEEEYRRRRDPIDERTARAVLDWEAERTVLEWFEGGEDPKALATARTRREAIDKLTLDKVSAALNPEQRERIPELGGERSLPRLSFD